MRFISFGNENVLPIWQKIWSLFFLIGFTSYIVGNFVKPLDDWKFLERVEIIHISLLILFLIGFWDLILFFFKTFKSVKKLSKYLSIDEKIHELNSIKNYARIILFLLGINLIVVFFAIFAKTASHIENLKDSFSDTMKKYTAKIVLASLIGFFGLLSWFLKKTFANSWSYCSCTNVHKKIGYFMEGKIGTSKIWIFNIVFMLFILLCSLGVLLGLLFWKHNLLSFLKITDSKLEISKLPLQIAICILAFIALIIISNHIIYIKKDRKFINYKMSFPNLSERHVYDLIKAKKNTNEVWWLNVWFMCLWLISSSSLAIVAEGIHSNDDLKNICKYVFISILGLMLLTLPMMIISQSSVRKNLNKCLHIINRKNKHLSNLNFLY